MAKGKFQPWINDEGLLKLEGWARDGLNDEQIAHNIGISRQTLYKWEAKYSDICDALKKGKEIVDREVENALLKRAKGFQTTEHQYKVVDVDQDVLWARRTKKIQEYMNKHPEATETQAKIWAIEHVETRQKIEIFQNQKEIPPDTTAMIFWLKNRKPNEWRDRKETQLSGSLDTNARPFKQIDDKKLDQIVKRLSGDDVT